MGNHDRNRRYGLAGGAAALLIITSLVGCTTGAEETPAATEGSGDSTLSAAVQTAMEPIAEWPGPSDPVEPVSGKKVTIITCGSTGITCVRVANGAKAASDALGWDATIVDGQNQPAVWNTVIGNALAAGTEALILAAVPPVTVQAAVDSATEAGIPVVYVLGLDDPSAVATIDMPREKAAEYMAEWLANDSGGSAKVFQLNVTDFPEAVAYNEALAAKLVDICSGCEIVDDADFSMALANQRIPGLVSSALQTNPDITYVSAPFDAVSLFVNQGIQQSGLTGVKVVGLGADPEGIQGMNDGTMAASVAMPAEWMGWQAIDTAVRYFADAEIETPEIPIRLITQENVQSDTESGWQGDIDYEAKYLELWGK